MKEVEVVVINHPAWTKQSWQLQIVAMTDLHVLLRDERTWYLCEINGLMVKTKDGLGYGNVIYGSDVKAITSESEVVIQTNHLLPIGEQLGLFWVKQQTKVTTFID